MSTPTKDGAYVIIMTNCFICNFVLVSVQHQKCNYYDSTYHFTYHSTSTYLISLFLTVLQVASSSKNKSQLTNQSTKKMKPAYPYLGYVLYDNHFDKALSNNTCSQA